MKIKKLRRTHATFDLLRIERNRDLFDGGDRFAKNVARYLVKNEQEPALVYKRRCSTSADEYLNYCGPIGNYFTAWLFSSQLTFKTDPENIDKFYDDFKENVDGEGCELDHFLAHRFVDAIQDGVSYWRVQFPVKPPVGATDMVLKDWNEQGLGRATLMPMPASSVINWKKDDDDEFEWLVEYTMVTGLEEPDDEAEMVTETWTIWRADGDHQRFEIRYEVGKKPRDEQDAPEVDMPASQGMIEGMPVVSLHMPPQMWIMNLIAAPQLANFRKRAALSWAIDRNCYATPVFKIKNKRKPPTMGTGYYIMIGIEEDVVYAAPPAAPFAVIKEFVTELKDEIHRLAVQMARGVENNAAAIGRSGISKQSDDMATEIVLAGYGRHMRSATKKTMDLVSQGRADVIEHTVGGMETYHVTDADGFSKMALAAQGMDIPSATHHRLVAKRQSTLMLPDADEADRQTINDEIDEGITPESLEMKKNQSLGLTPTGEDPAVLAAGAKGQGGEQPPEDNKAPPDKKAKSAKKKPAAKKAA